MSNKNQSDGSVFRVDKFVVPAEARHEILGKVRMTHELLRRQDGFVAVVAGRAPAARARVAKRADPAVLEQAKRLSADFAKHRGRLVGHPRQTGAAQWAFAYRRRINGKKGAFSRERGYLVVDTADGVTFAAIIGRVIDYSTHHDSVLLPSKR